MILTNLKPTKEKINTFLPLGSIFVIFAFLDVLTNTFLNQNITGFLPQTLSYIAPLLLGYIGFYLIRIEFSGIKFLDKLNKNINSSNFNAFLTLLILFIIIKAISPLMNWLILEANFEGSSKDDCTGNGACWVFIKVWFNRLMYGLYPDVEQWRVNSAFILLFALVGIAFFVPQKIKKYFIIFLLFVYPFIGIKLLSGGSFGLVYVETAAWGGLSLTFIISAFAILFCFPIGVLLALGRRSSLPAIRYISIGFIELWRGVPLITVLFMAAVMFPMFLPDGTFVDKLIRVLIAITLFEAAYMAEVVRGGLQALPKGQYEAAKSLGMGYWKMNTLIILPQALKLVIPGIANTLLALVKDTPLIFVVGLMELAGMIGLAKTNPKWLGMAMEGYVFAGLVFWIICYAMSRYSQNLEKKLSTER
ncbi:amino acid ABC transporter permease [Candidatus Pelagibacter bacterium]|nr:amino acid ABC transporter permease [Candidatus Pelagibacter bacterium]